MIGARSLSGLGLLISSPGLAVYLYWWLADASDDGVEVDPYQRLARRRGTAARIDPGVALAEKLFREDWGSRFPTTGWALA